MKKVLLASACLFALAAPASAADLAARPYTKAPVAMASVYNWTGFYLGIVGGGAWEDSSGDPKMKGGFVGGTAGYNWQTGNVVFGIEADGAWADVSASATGPVAVPGFGVVTTTLVTESPRMHKTFCCFPERWISLRFSRPRLPPTSCRSPQT